MQIRSAQVILYVNDMARSLAYYRDALGLAVTFDGGDYWMTLDAGGTSLALHPGGSGLASGDRTGISLMVDDLESCRAEANARGAGFGEVVNPHPGVTFCEAKDPDGNPVFLKPA